MAVTGADAQTIEQIRRVGPLLHGIEHAFWEATGTYEAFEGVCLVDTFETAEKKQKEFLTLFF